MAFTTAFRNNQQLQQFVLPGVTTTGRLLGTGSYGSVEEVIYKRISCAGKRLHEALIDVENEGAAEMVQKYLQECQLMSSLHHPNITQFLGLCFLTGTRLPLLVMERLETSLDDLLEHMPNLPLSLKRSLLEDVASGLLYLHERPSPIIHRDLTARNVLLTSSLVAKITDMGNSRIIDMRPGQMARTLSALPGTLVYMPPEALDDRHRYGPSLDVFSFGTLSLFTIIQKFPGSLLPSTYLNPDNPGQLLGRTEVERREQYIDLLESRILSSNFPDLVHLVKQCLHNDPYERPNADALLSILQRMKVEVEGDYGGPFRLDMVRVRLAKEVKVKDRRIEELTQQQVTQGAELQQKDRRIGELTQQQVTQVAELQEKAREVEALQELQAENLANIDQLQNEVADKEESIQTLESQMQHRQNTMQAQKLQIQRQQNTIQTQESQIQELHSVQAQQREELQSKDSEITRLMKELSKVPLQFPLQLRWRRGPDMPLKMRGYVQSVVVQGKAYVGGGSAGSDDSYIVLEYDISSGKWAMLPPYRARYFAMTVIDNQLVLVGGWEHGHRSKALGVWEAENWSHVPYPDMCTARSECSAVVYNEWLAVAGGVGNGERLSSVEVMNTDSKKWYAAPPTPTPWSSMRTAIVGDTCYFMGGYTERASYGLATEIYIVSLPALLSRLQSRKRGKKHSQLWKEIPGLQATLSTPLSISGSLLAVGGMDDDHNVETAIHLYQPDSCEWVKVGDLPTPRCWCACTMIAEKDMLVAGGEDCEAYLHRSDIALISTL